MKPDPAADFTGARCFLLSQTLKGYSNLDPPPKQQPAIPFIVIEKMFSSSESFPSSIKHAMSQLTCGAFFHGMRSCEYSKTCSNEESKRTKILILRNFRFYRDGRMLDLTKNQKTLHLADFVNITFIFQKNQERNESVGMYKTEDKRFCPVMTWANIIVRILSYPGSSLDFPVHTWYDPARKQFKYITSHLIRIQLRCVAVSIGKEILGFDPKDIGCHSIRSGFAMALVLINTHPMTIMIAGRWKSEAFLKYVRKQVALFTINLSKKMLQNRDFFTVPNYNKTLSSSTPTVNGPLDRGVFRSKCLITNMIPTQVD